MIRTQIQLLNEQYQELKRIGGATGESVAEQIRQAVALYLARKRRRKKGVREIAGNFKPLAAAGQNDRDRWFVEAITDTTKRSR